MSIWDKMLPHRQLINRSLRKNADELKSHIDAYKLRYDEQYQKNLDELERTRNNLDQQYEDAKTDVLALLSSTAEDLQNLETVTTAYISACFERQLIYKKQELNSIQQDAVKEYIDYLTNQMKLIGTDVDQLRERRNLLSRRAKIDDVLQLVKLTGNNFLAVDCENAQELLDLVGLKIKEIGNDNEVERYALLNLRTLLEERVSFQDEIQYISWVIEQKIQLSKELKGIREIQILVQDKLRDDANQLESTLQELNDLIQAKARDIRFYWAREIIYASVDITELKAEKRAKIEEIKDKRREKEDIQSQIESMKSSHSSDSWKWDRLWSDKKDLSSNIQSLSSEITSVDIEISAQADEKKKLIERRKNLLSKLWEHSVALIRIGSKDQHDEEIYADTRLQELEAIEEAGKVVAEAAYQSEVSRLQVAKQSELVKAEHNISKRQEELLKQEENLQDAEISLKGARSCAAKKAKTRAEEIEQSLTKAKKVSATALQRLTALRTADNRFILIRIFSETPEIQRAKQVVDQADEKVKDIEKNLLDVRNLIKTNLFPQDPEVQTALQEIQSAKEKLKQAQTDLEAAQEEYRQIEQEFDCQISQTKPHPERPTPSEISEMCKLRSWKKQQRELQHKRRQK